MKYEKSSFTLCKLCYVKHKHELNYRIFSWIKSYVFIHVIKHDMDHNMDLNYRRKIRPLILKVLVQQYNIQFFWFFFVRTWGEHVDVVYRNCSVCQKQFMYTTCFPHVLSLEFSCIELFYLMNNLSSYCGLVDAKIRASDKDYQCVYYEI